MNLRLQAAGYDVITLDGETPRHEARDSLGPAQVLQDGDAQLRPVERCVQQDLSGAVPGSPDPDDSDILQPGEA